METKTLIFRLKNDNEVNQRELEAYKKIGSVYYLRRLKQQEIKRRKRINVVKKVFRYLYNILYGAGIAFMVWLFLSWVDVVSHNMDPNPVYQVWNLFQLFA